MKQNIEGSFEKIHLKSVDLEQFFLTPIPYDFITVTMPHKKAVMDFCTSFTDDARAMGAVNFILRRGEELIGCNFDGVGTLDPIEDIEKVKGKKVVIYGVGGAARAAIYEAKKRGALVYCINRTASKGMELASFFDISYKDEIPDDFDVFINATPIGMDSQDKRILVKNSQLLHKKIVLDMASRTGDCLLARQTKQAGGIYISGKEMFYSLTLAGLALIQNSLVST